MAAVRLRVLALSLLRWVRGIFLAPPPPSCAVGGGNFAGCSRGARHRRPRHRGLCTACAEAHYAWAARRRRLLWPLRTVPGFLAAALLLAVLSLALPARAAPGAALSQPALPGGSMSRPATPADTAGAIARAVAQRAAAQAGADALALRLSLIAERLDRCGSRGQQDAAFIREAIQRLSLPLRGMD